MPDLEKSSLYRNLASLGVGSFESLKSLIGRGNFRKKVEFSDEDDGILFTSIRQAANVLDISAIKGPEIRALHNRITILATQLNALLPYIYLITQTHFFGELEGYSKVDINLMKSALNDELKKLGFDQNNINKDDYKIGQLGLVVVGGGPNFLQFNRKAHIESFEQKWKLQQPYVFPFIYDGLQILLAKIEPGKKNTQPSSFEATMSIVPMLFITPKDGIRLQRSPELVGKLTLTNCSDVMVPGRVAARFGHFGFPKIIPQ